ncbi:MAG: Gfo/Idh/MocA family oxidoreductase [Acidimicrobiia bacterium]
MLTPLKLAIVGVGRMGQVHARILSQIDEVDLVAVVDGQSDIVEALAKELDVLSYSNVGAIPGEHGIQAWLIATPTPTHPDLVRIALDAGMNVLCEKPLSLDPSEGAELGELADRKGLVLQIGFWRRFSPPWTAARRSLLAGAIGEPVMIRLSQWDANPPPPAFCDPSVSGGLAIDCGVHEFDLVEWFTGSTVVSVTGRNLRLVDPAVGTSGDVDNLLALLDLENGVTATVDLSRNSRYGDDVRTEILGSEGALLIDLLPTGQTRLATASGIHILEDSRSSDATADGIANQGRAFVARVRGGAFDVPGAAVSTRAVEIGRAIQRSTNTGLAEPVSVV